MRPVKSRVLFAAHIPDGDLGAFATALPRKIRDDFTATLKLLRDPAFQKLLFSYPRPRPDFLIAYGVADTVSSTLIVRDSAGNEYKAEDYLDAFARYVRDNQDRIAAIRILLDRPKSWNTAVLTELKHSLAATEQQFTKPRLQSASAYRSRTPSPHSGSKDLPSGHLERVKKPDRAGQGERRGSAGRRREVFLHALKLAPGDDAVHVGLPSFSVYRVSLTIFCQKPTGNSIVQLRHHAAFDKQGSISLVQRERPFAPAIYVADRCRACFERSPRIISRWARH